MSYFNLSDNSALTNSTSFDANPDIEPIPDGTVVNLMVDNVKWESSEYEFFIRIKWVVTTGQYLKRIVMQKIRIEHADPAKRDKAMRMFAAVDANLTGGQIVAKGEKPTDELMMMNWQNKTLRAKLGVWESEDSSAKGNWVQAVLAKDNSAPEAPQAFSQAQQTKAPVNTTQQQPVAPQHQPQTQHQPLTDDQIPF